MKYLKNISLIGFGFVGGFAFGVGMMLSKALKNERIRQTLIVEAADKIEDLLFNNKTAYATFD